VVVLLLPLSSAMDNKSLSMVMAVGVVVVVAPVAAQRQRQQRRWLRWTIVTNGGSVSWWWEL
jgi:hypothetical protein